jgi:hypothetical protein
VVGNSPWGLSCSCEFKWDQYGGGENVPGGVLTGSHGRGRVCGGHGHGGGRRNGRMSSS